MSYEKVKSVKIDEKEGKVYLTSACNNVRPLTYEKWELKSLSTMLKEKGRRAVEIEILKNYESGNFQGGTNKFTKAYKVLYYVFKDEYAKFNWRNHNAKWDTPEREEEERLRKSDEFKELLSRCLDYKFPKEKWVITKDHYSAESGKVYGRKNPTSMGWRWNKDKATKFDFKEEAIDNIFIRYKDEWGVEKL